MTFKTIAAASVAATAALAMGPSAFAQAAAPAAPAATPVTNGPPITGLCIIQVEGAIGSSTVGKYVVSRLQQIGAQVNAELSAEGKGIEAERNTLETQRSTLDQNTFEQRAAALQVRANAFERKLQLRQREVDVTRQKAFERVELEMRPVMQQAYQQKNCSVLLNGDSVLAANPAMDITPQVVAGLNAKITTFAFDREHLDQPGQASAAPPVATIPAPTTPPKKK